MEKLKVVFSIMLKIGLICRIAWPVKGGLTWHALRLGQEIKKLGVEFEIITRFTKRDIQGNDYFWQNEESRTFDNEGVTTHVIGLSKLDRLLLWPVSRLRTRKWLRPVARDMVKYVMGPKFVKILKQYDLVHYDGAGSELMSYAALGATRILNKKFIVQPSIHLGQWGCEKIDHQLYRASDTMFVHSNIEKMYLIDSVGLEEKKIHVVGNGIDDIRGGSGKRFREKYGVNGIMALYFGRRSHDKGYYLVHEAFEKISKMHSDAWLAVIGPLQYGQKQWRPLETHPGKSRIIELDFVDEQTRRDAFDACDIFLQPSIGESFGLVFLEAALCGKLVIGRNLKILDELLGQHNAAVLIGKRKKDGTVELDINELVEQWSYLIKNPNFRNQIGAIGKIVSEKHLWRNVIHKFKNAYDCVLNGDIKQS